MVLLDNEAMDAASMERQCVQLQEQIRRVQKWSRAVELSANWQRTTATRLGDHFESLSGILAQSRHLSRSTDTWARYQCMACEALSLVYGTAQYALLSEVQILSSRFPERQFPFPHTLEQAHDCLDEILERCIRDALAAEARVRAAKARRDEAAAENGWLQARLQALCDELEGPTELLEVRRVPVVSTTGAPTPIRIRGSANPLAPDAN